MADKDQTGIDWEAQERAAMQAEDEADSGEVPEDRPDAPANPSHPRDTHFKVPETTPAPVAPMVRPNLAPTNKDRLQTFGNMLSKALPRVRNIIPKHLDGERIFGLAYMAMERNPKLLDCTAISVLRGIIIGAQMGLDITGIGGGAYLVPYRNNKTGNMEAQFIPGWRGLVDLARRSGEVSWIYANIVYQNEQFTYVVDPIPRVIHKPMMITAEVERGQAVGAYALAVFRDKDVPPMPHVMSALEINRIRSRSKAADNGPWVTDTMEMWKKTPVRALCKYLPQSPELAEALVIEDSVESGLEIRIPGELPDEAQPEEPTPDASSGNERVKAKMAKKNAGKATQ